MGYLNKVLNVKTSVMKKEYTPIFLLISHRDPVTPTGHMHSYMCELTILHFPLF